MTELEEFKFAEPGETILTARPTHDGAGTNCIEVSFRHGASGIKLFADGTSETWGGYEPQEAAAEFWRLVSQAMALNTPRGSA